MGVTGLWKRLQEAVPGAFRAVGAPSGGGGGSSSGRLHILVDLNGLLHQGARMARVGREDAAVWSTLDAVERWIVQAVRLLQADGGGAGGSREHRARRRGAAVSTGEAGVDEAAMPAGHGTASEVPSGAAGPAGRPLEVSVFLGVDGPPPWQKMLLQRDRRSALSAKREKKKTSEAFDVIQITPGCQFMERLDRYLVYHATRLMGQPFQSLLGGAEIHEVIVSGSRVPGEGDAKINARIQALYDAGGRDDSFVVVSGDADAMVQ
ncbi:hypothetical protein HK405_015592, partial [Cladochytrium tenue]